MKTIFTIAAVLTLISGVILAQTVSTLVTGPSTFNDGLAIDRLGNIYAAMYDGVNVTKITPGGQTSIFAGGMTSPNGLAFGPNGDLFVPNAKGGRITRITPAGDTSTYIHIPDPGAVYINADGSMLVAHYVLNRISLIDTAKNVSVYLNDTTKLNGPIGLVRDAKGILYVGNFTDGRIFRVTESKTMVQIGQIPGALGFMTIVNDMIFATGYTQHRIYRVPVSGSGAVVLIGTGTAGSTNGTSKATFSNPNGIVASLTGDSLFVSDYTTRSLRVISGVKKFTSSVRLEESWNIDFHLEQNYPNPFNPVTTISYSVPFRSHVTLKVYSMLGSEIATLTNDVVPEGTHSVVFGGNNLASGTYLIRLTSGGLVRTMKATLIK
jgi:sugar lactone lactonase YvrE